MATYSKAQVKAAVKAALEQCRPVGSYLLFAGKTLPTGYLLCNGAAVSRTTYAALFAVIGTTYGAGNGSTTFNLPNLDGRVLQGVNDLSKVGTKLESGLPNITGWLPYVRSIRPDGADGYHSEGALTWTEASRWEYAVTAADRQGAADIWFDAHNKNSIYNDNNSKVQNPAVRTLIAIRY